MTSAPLGSAASSSIEAESQKLSSSATAVYAPQRTTYMQRLALRREADELRRLIVYGLTVGWILTLVAGFLFFCVKSRLDWLWCSLTVVGVVHLAAAVVLPQVLFWPERIWMTIARWQGHMVMTLLLTAVYYLLLWPASQLSRQQIVGFYRWGDEPPPSSTCWQAIDMTADDSRPVSTASYRGLPLLLASVIGFFYRRGNYILLPIIVLLLILGLVLFIVQSTALAPFIYPLF